MKLYFVCIAQYVCKILYASRLTLKINNDCKKVIIIKNTSKYMLYISEEISELYIGP